MKTTTPTQVTHYEIQKKRRESLLEEWKGYHKTIIKRADVLVLTSRAAAPAAASTPAGTATGRRRTSTRPVHEILPRHDDDDPSPLVGRDQVRRVRPAGPRSTACASTGGHGTRSISRLGVAPSRQRPRRAGGRPPWSVQPMLEQFGVALLEDGGDTPVAELPQRPRQVATSRGEDPYARRTQRLARKWERPESARLDHALRRCARPGDEARRPEPVPCRQVDRLSHRRPVGGDARARAGPVPIAASPRRRGLAVRRLGTRPQRDRRRRLSVGAGDLIVVDHWSRHQHFNDDKQHTRVSIRVHNFDALYDMIRILLDPLTSSRSSELDAPDLSGVVWPDHFRRPPSRRRAALTSRRAWRASCRSRATRRLLADRWDRIFVADGIKERLLNCMFFSLRQRGRSSDRRPADPRPRSCSPARPAPEDDARAGLADRAPARARRRRRSCSSTSTPTPSRASLLGESQRSVARLFERTLPDIARRGRPTIVLLDEVESMAVSRTGASLETNPVDVHRATDAVLAGLDQVARAART